MISVIVPVYNVKPYLEEAIDSIISQSYKNLEIILVDDGSTDGSGEVCDAYEKKDARIKVIHQSNKGLSAARNTGLDACAGEYIAFLDPDDAFCKDCLKIMLDLMLVYNVDIVECNCAIFNSDYPMDEGKINKKQKIFGNHLKHEGVYDTKEALNMLCEGRIAVNAWNKLYRQSIWHKLRFREGQNYEDIDIIFSVMERVNEVCLADESLIMHRERKGSITHVISYSNIIDNVIAWQHFLQYVIDHTPSYFTQEVQYQQFEKMARLLLSKYCRFSWLKIPEKNECMDFLRNRIDAFSHNANMNHCKTRVKVAYFLYNHMPKWMFIFVFSIFRFIKKAIRIVHR